jgi:hypothetical protein
LNETAKPSARLGFCGISIGVEMIVSVILKTLGLNFRKRAASARDELRQRMSAGLADNCARLSQQRQLLSQTEGLPLSLQPEPSQA